MAGARARRSTARRRRERAELKLPLSLEEGFCGATKSVRLADPESGDVQTIHVKVPPGTLREGATLRVPAGAGRGEVALQVTLLPHARYAVSGEDFVVKVPVAPWEAALGAKVEVQLPDGVIKVAVPAGVQSGSRLRVRGRGATVRAPSARGGERTRGDLLVELRIVVPATLSPRERELFEKLAAESSFNARSR
jgi:curved DNA-binding protein